MADRKVARYRDRGSRVMVRPGLSYHLEIVITFVIDMTPVLEKKEVFLNLLHCLSLRSLGKAARKEGIPVFYFTFNISHCSEHTELLSF